VKNVDDVDLLSPDSIDDSVWLFNQLAKIFADGMRNRASGEWKG